MAHRRRILTESERRERLMGLDRLMSGHLPISADISVSPQLPQPKETPMGRPTVVIVGADKGGVGKTTIARTLLGYLKDQGIDAQAFDTESPDGNLVRFHADQTKVVDLTHSDGQMEVFDSMARAPFTVIDVRAGLLTPTLKLLSELGFIDMVKEGKIDLVVLHVIGSTVASFNEIRATGKIIEGTKHFIVLNHTNDAAFFDGIEGVAKDALQSGSGLLDIPQLNPRATEFVEAASQPFGVFAEDVRHSLTIRQFVKAWLKKVYAQLETAKLVNR